MPLTPSRLCLGLGFCCLLPPPAWFGLVSDSARREWVLSQPGLGGLGSGPAQLWAVAFCLLTAVLLLGLGLALKPRQLTPKPQKTAKKTESLSSPSPSL